MELGNHKRALVKTRDTMAPYLPTVRTVLKAGLGGANHQLKATEMAFS